ncbi:MAG TPA: type II toxin-antitoxin system HipA family toxin [Pseudobdellovibrionaceae bacterium]|jgi:serine/threonine-protein kinase HipA
MKKVDVFYSGWGEHWKLGRLADNGTKLLFEYTAEALEQGLELSPLNLKLKSEAYGEFPTHQQRLPGLIADSLPDGWGLLLMDKLFRKQGLAIEEVSPLDRLSFLGDRAMGALIFKPASESVAQPKGLSLLEIGTEVHKIVSEKASSALSELAILGGSPQGARPKVLAYYQKKTKQLSMTSVPTAHPWLFKFPAQQEHKEVCAIEALYAKLAKKAGLEIKETEYFELSKNLSAFGTKRFDRENDLRIPTHTLAGALNADFRRSFSVDYLSLLRLTRLMTKDEREVHKAFRQCLFNVIFNNRDDHAKNFSFLLDDKRRWKLSPAYDLTFNAGPGGEHQMDICGEGRAPTKTHLLKLAEKSGIHIKVFEEILEEVTAAARQFKTEAKNWPLRTATIHTIHQTIQANSKRLKL